MTCQGHRGVPISCVCVSSVVASTCLPCTFRVKVKKAHVLFPKSSRFPLFATLFFQPTYSQDEWATRPDSHTKITDHNVIYSYIQFSFPFCCFLMPDQVITLTKALFLLPLAGSHQELSLCCTGRPIVRWAKASFKEERESSELQHVLQ